MKKILVSAVIIASIISCKKVAEGSNQEVQKVLLQIVLCAEKYSLLLLA